ncbi:cell wall-active antibiotics response protein [Gephyromycinifex aptenodytis]|uniref:cell wall-active antibiotics response protein n=1 Tax=Gephyromycinifex aptenodytis TaxID=2716227 RepID=UPI0014485AFF|nr:cell wall-active antibiotics response protein [Gephyromycinifex aptenodytis]
MSFDKPVDPQDPQDVVPSERLRPAGDLEAMRQVDLPVIGAQPSPPVLSPVPAPPMMVSVLGDVRRSGRFTLGAKTKAVAMLGDILLDLREAEFTASEIEMDAYSLMGDLKLIVPPDVEVVIRGLTILGNQRNEPGQHAAAPRRRVVLHVHSLMGDVKVKTLAPGEVEPTWWRRLLG